MATKDSKKSKADSKPAPQHYAVLGLDPNGTVRFADDRPDEQSANELAEQIKVTKAPAVEYTLVQPITDLEAHRREYGYGS